METITSKLVPCDTLGFFKKTTPKIIPLVGYSNGNTDYKRAKTPIVKWQDSPGLSQEEARAWIEQKGWIGLVIPEGHILIDVDARDTGDVLQRCFHDNGLRYIGIKTPGGHQFFFKDSGRVKYQGSKMLTVSGLVVDYRLPEKGYIVLPTENTENRDTLNVPSDALDAMPMMFVPARRVNAQDVPLQIPISEGSRNDVLFRDVTSRMKGLNETHRLGLTEEDRLQVVEEVNRFFCDPPLPDREVESLFLSSEKYIIDNKDNRTIVDSQRSTDLPVLNCLDNTIDILSILKKGSDLLLLDIKVEWLIDKLVPKQSITLLHGRGGIGKTWLTLIMADAVSRGIPFMDLNTEQTPVVFVDFENSYPVLVERVQKIQAGEVLFWHNTNEVRPPKLDRAEWEQYKQVPRGLLVFDTLRASQSQDENDSRHMAGIMSRLKELRDEGWTILLLHHTPKSNDRTYKGSTAIIDLADHVLSLHKVRKGTEQEAEDDEDSNYYRFGTKDKTRYEPFHLFLEFDKEQGFVVASDPDTERLEEIHDLLKDREPMKQGDVFELAKTELGITSKGTLHRLLRRGTGMFWTTEKEPHGRAIRYCPIVQPPIRNNLDNSSGRSPQSLDNKALSYCPDMLFTNKDNNKIGTDFPSENDLPEAEGWEV